jgi:hypothetical protein
MLAVIREVWKRGVARQRAFRVLQKRGVKTPAGRSQGQGVQVRPPSPTSCLRLPCRRAVEVQPGPSTKLPAYTPDDQWSARRAGAIGCIRRVLREARRFTAGRWVPLCRAHIGRLTICCGYDNPIVTVTGRIRWSLGQRNPVQFGLRNTKYDHEQFPCEPRFRYATNSVCWEVPIGVGTGTFCQTIRWPQTTRRCLTTLHGSALDWAFCGCGVAATGNRRCFDLG